MAYVFVRWTISDGAFSVADLGVGLVAADAITLLLPVNGENVDISFQFAAWFSGVPVLGGLLAWKGVFVIPWMMLMVAVALSVGFLIKYKNVRRLFDAEQAWRVVEADARWLYLMLFFVLCSFLLVAESIGNLVFIGVMIALLALLYAVLLLRSYIGKTAFLDSRKEKKIKDTIRGMMPSVKITEDEEEDVARMGRLYDKIVLLMEKKKPYLDEYYSLPEMAATVFSNKSYLSRTINLFSGRNFCQFVNYYRVMYSVDLMRKDPHLRVSEIAMMSGFHTVVTYNMAFKLNMNVTPSEYLQQIRLEAREDPSSLMEQAQ